MGAALRGNLREFGSISENGHRIDNRQDGGNRSLIIATVRERWSARASIALCRLPRCPSATALNIAAPRLNG